MLKQVTSGGMAAETDLPATTRHNIKDFHSRAWFITSYSDGSSVTQTAAGSRPGESWSDIVFGWVYSRILARITEHATADCDPDTGPFAEAHQGIETTAADATWADDSAWPLSNRDPEALVQKTIRLCTLVISFCWQHGLKPNLRPGKSAVMLTLRGRGSYKARSKHFQKSGQQLRLPDLDVAIPIANQYRHLGGIVDGEPKLAIEARRRTAIASSAYEAGKKIFFNNPCIPMTTKVALFQAAIDPIYFNLGLWAGEGQSWKVLSGGYTRILRSMANAAPLPLWAMLQEEQTWIRAVQSDLRWVAEGSEDKWPCCGGAGWPEWAALLGRSSPWLKRQVRRRLRPTPLPPHFVGALQASPWISFLLKRPSLISGYTGFATRASRAGVALELISSRFTSEKRATEGCSPALPVWPAGATDYHSENRLLIHLGMHLLAPGSSGPKATGPSGCDLALEARSGKRRPKRWTSWPCRQRFTPRRQAQEENAPRRTLSPRHTVRSTTASRPTIWSPCRPGPPCPDPAQLPPLPRGG